MMTMPSLNCMMLLSKPKTNPSQHDKHHDKVLRSIWVADIGSMLKPATQQQRSQLPSCKMHMTSWLGHTSTSQLARRPTYLTLLRNSVMGGDIVGHGGTRGDCTGVSWASTHTDGYCTTPSCTDVAFGEGQIPPGHERVPDCCIGKAA